MTKEEEKKFREMVTIECKRMRNQMVINWAEFTLYLEKEYSEGKTEFRIAFQDATHVIVHPLGKDGKTLDMEIE